MELKELLKNPGTAAFSLLKYIPRHGSEEQIAQFINELFIKAAEAKYTGDWEELLTFLEHWDDVGTSLQFENLEVPKTESIPWASLAKPLSQCRIALVTTGGVYVEGQKPFEPRDDTIYREFPSDAPKEKLRILHRGYDNGPANEDINCILPIDVFKELETEGVIGSLAQTIYSFMGMIYDTDTLSNVTAPEVGRRLKEEGVDAAFLAST